MENKFEKGNKNTPPIGPPKNASDIELKAHYWDTLIIKQRVNTSILDYGSLEYRINVKIGDIIKSIIKDAENFHTLF